MLSCPQCGKEVQDGWKFCRSCGHALATAAVEPEVSISSQVSSEDWDKDLMRRLDPGQMRGLLNKRVVVDEGQTALLSVLDSGQLRAG